MAFMGLWTCSLFSMGVKKWQHGYDPRTRDMELEEPLVAGTTDA